VPSVMAPYENAGFFVMRTPLLPYRHLFELSEGVVAKRGLAPGELDEQLAREQAGILRALEDMLASPTVREAIFIASPSLDAALARWQRGELEPEAERKAVRALYRYVSRMASRSTPFGLFAGSSIGRLTRDTQLKLDDPSGQWRHTTLDSCFVFELLEVLGADPGYREVATYYPNRGLYRAGGRLRYAETSTDAASASMRYELVSLERDEYLDAVVARAEQGAMVAELVELLVANHEVVAQEAREFIELLIDHQLLVSDLSLAVTGLAPLADARQQLGRHPDRALRASVDLAAAQLRELDAGGLGQRPGAYARVVEALDRLPVGELEPSRLFHVNLWRPLAHERLGRELIAQLRATVAQLHRIAPVPPRTELDLLADAFRARYGGDLVPLGLALDPELGITATGPTIASESSAMLEGLSFATPDLDASFARPGADTGSARDQILLAKLHQIWRRGEHQWVLDEAELEALEVGEDKPPLPTSFAAWFQLGRKRDANGVCEGHELLFTSAVGPPAARLLGRFAHGNPELAELTRELARREAALEPDSVLAEIAHLPEGRTGNVVCRPVMREFEIPYLGKSGAPLERQLPIDDLWVGVEDGRFVLWSRRLECRVIPRLTCAHNITNNTVPLYRFLARLQSQAGYPWLVWSWGRLDRAPHLPRVVIGGAIVARETWTIAGHDLTPLRRASTATRHRHLLALRETYDLPRWVALADGDNELAVDLDNPVSIDALADLIKSRPRARLVELWPGPDAAAVDGEDGAHVAEIIVPFVRGEPRERRAEPEAGSSVAPAWTTPPRFAPGSECLRLDLVTSKSSADELIVTLADELHALTGEGVCERWSFAPAHAGSFAIRLFVHGEGARLESLAFSRLGRALRALSAGALLASWSVETHVPELASCGGPRALASAQALACVDSRAAVALLTELRAAGSEDVRGMLALVSVDRLLADLELALDERVELLDSLRARLLRSLPVGETIERELARKFRSQRAHVDAWLMPEGDADLRARAASILAERSDALAPIVTELHVLRDAGLLTRPWRELAGALTRATTQRLLRGATEAHELVVYDLLHRAYRSRIGRARARRARAERAATEAAREPLR
jgi:thiopeptide-type bacteriocin biosynthesis protein